MASRFFCSSSFVFLHTSRAGVGAAGRALTKSQKINGSKGKNRRDALEMGEIELFRAAVIRDRQGRTRVSCSLYLGGRKGSRGSESCGSTTPWPAGKVFT